MIITSGASAVLLLKEGARLPEPETEVSESSDVPALIRALGDPCYPVRRAAYELLRGKEAKIVAQLDAAAKSKDAEVAWRAAQLAADKRRLIRIAAFRQIAPPIIKERLPHYLVRATEPDYRIRLQFLREACALGNSEAILRQIAPFIKEFLKDESWAVRLEAALGLLKCGDSSGDREIESALASEELAVRRNTVTILAQYSSVAAALLIRALDDKDYQVRLAAVNGLAKSGASTALTKLGELLKQDELDIKLACVRALVSCGKELSVPLLSPALTDKAREVRIAAVEALANMDRQQAIKALIPALADTDEAIFDFVAEVIYEYADSSFDKAVPLLAQLLKAERRKTRSYAQQLLGEIGTRGAANALVECLTDPDTDLSDWAADYLLNEADASAVPSLAAKLSHKNTRVRYFAVQILAHIGASECVRPLLKMTGDKDERIVSTAFRALRLTVETAHIPEILKLHIHDKKRAVRLAMDSLLGKLTKRVLIPGLIDTLQSSGRDIQLSALRMLKEKSGKDFGFHPDRDEKTRRRAINRWREWWVKESVPEKRLKKLLADLKKGVPSERWRAAERLAGIKSGTVIGALVEALDEELAWVLKAKIEALQKLTGKSFGYKKSLAPDKVKSVIGKWRNWWSKARKDY
jgi:HEAT repeat protein